jgi:hypothetical protein
MQPQEIAEQFKAAFERQDYQTCMNYLDDGFTFSGPVPKPLNAEQWMGTVKGMHAAFPDINYNLTVTGAEGNKVKVSTQLTGTHTADWDMSAMGMGVVPATNKSFSNPKEHGVMTVESGKITSYEISASEGGGVPGVLKQLGVQPPA